MKTNPNKWLVNQIGSRENYAIAEALQSQSQLHLLQTDLWFNPINPAHTIIRKFLPTFSNRNNSEIPVSKVACFNLRNMVLKKQLSNGAYEESVKKMFLHKVKSEQYRYDSLFSYNYSAYEGFTLANKLNKNCILGQVDAGPVAGSIITELFKREGVGLSHRKDYYKVYKDKWVEECAMAKRIIVNSQWSKRCIVEAGIESSKIRIVPLSFSGFSKALPAKLYPEVFSKKRPLTVVYVGRVSLQKGCLEILRAAEKLLKAPIEFKLIGAWDFPPDMTIDIPENVQLLGRKSKQELSFWYKKSDVMLFPTYTDGFGKVLLEAQNFKLPLITSGYCGDVVKPNINGLLLENNDAKCIIDALNQCLETPSLLQEFSNRSIPAEDHSIQNIATQLVGINNSLSK
jgi:glycosyltransferase involved in cell wall biosynthesis